MLFPSVYKFTQQSLLGHTLELFESFEQETRDKTRKSKINFFIYLIQYSHNLLDNLVLIHDQILHVYYPKVESHFNQLEEE